MARARISGAFDFTAFGDLVQCGFLFFVFLQAQSYLQTFKVIQSVSVWLVNKQ